MNEARKKVEEFKKSLAPDRLRNITWNIKVENSANMDYHTKRIAEEKAFDEEVARRVGVTLTDAETWPEERSKILAHEWAEKLPDVK